MPSNSNYPGSLDSWTDPQPTDFENVVSHALQHDKENDALAAIETKLGIDSSTVTTSIDYLVKTAANPGHTHTVLQNVQGINLLVGGIPSGPGIWTDGASVYVNSAGFTGGVILRPNGSGSTNYQFKISQVGAVTTSGAAGSIQNTLDDGSGNMNIAGNLTVGGTFSASFSYGSPSTSNVGDNPSPGIAISIARSDHVHGRESWSLSLPLSDIASGVIGTSRSPAHADHQHPGNFPLTALTTNSNFGDIAANGTAAAYSHADHRHGRELLDTMTADITNSNFGDVAAAGNSGKAADASHKHGRESLNSNAANIQALATSAGAGSSHLAADAGHTHPYGTLANHVGLFGVSSPLLGGGGPGFTAPNFLIQAGSSVVTIGNNSGGFVLNFAVAFPNGLVTVLLAYGDNNTISTANVPIAAIGAQAGLGFTGGQIFGLTTGANVRINWIAIGW